MNLRERIQVISERWFVREPLLFMTLMSHEIAPAKGLRHLIRSGQGRIEYGFDCEPEKLSDEELEENLRAEVIRILLRHPYRHHGKKDAAYLASNITLNENYNFRFLKYKAVEIWENDVSCRNQNFEFYYRRILEMDGGEGGGDLTEKGKKSSSQGTGNANNSRQASESGITEHGGGDQTDMPTACSALWQEDDFMEQKIREIIEWAQTAMQWGTLPGNLVQTLVASLRPEIDYRKIISAFRTSVISGDKRLTRFKPSRRYGFLYNGKKSEFTTRLLIAVDVSGSVADSELQVFFSAVNCFFKYGIQSLDVLQFDTQVEEPVMDMRKAKKSVTVHGRGGTDFQPVIAFFEAARQPYDGLVIFTDGYAPVPEMKARSIRKTLWICNNKENYLHHEAWMKKCGRCCWIRKD